jgi:crotonobetainyl-CoA:carnitine CoA-transferase CaiB-like acyl-CoA transferase
VNDYAAVVADPQVWANGYLVKAEHPTWGEIAMVGSPLRMSATPAVPGVVAPELGQHTEEVLLEAGFDWDEIAELREQGAI